MHMLVQLDLHSLLKIKIVLKINIIKVNMIKVFFGNF